MHTDSQPPVFNLHLQCSRQVDGHRRKWNICPSPTQVTPRARRQDKWKQTLQMSQSHGTDDLALWLKCFPPSPVWCAASIYQSNEVAKGQVNQAQLLLLSFMSDSDAALSQAAAGWRLARMLEMDNRRTHLMGLSSLEGFLWLSCPSRIVILLSSCLKPVICHQSPAANNLMLCSETTRWGLQGAIQDQRQLLVFQRGSKKSSSLAYIIKSAHLFICPQHPGPPTAPFSPREVEHLWEGQKSFI